MAVVRTVSSRSSLESRVFGDAIDDFIAYTSAYDRDQDVVRLMRATEQRDLENRFDRVAGQVANVYRLPQQCRHSSRRRERRLGLRPR
jgi:hypothetical protein